MLWDMDGTLIDSEHMWIDAEIEMLARYGLTLSAELREQMIGVGLRDGAQLMRELGVELSVEEIIREWEEVVLAGLAAGKAAWRPGAPELLASLNAAGIPCALVTMSTRRIAEETVKLLPAGEFQAILGCDDVSHEKPHPEPYVKGAELLGVPISECLVLEDSVTGLKSAHAAGAVAVGVPNMVDLHSAPAAALWETLTGLDAAEVVSRFAVLRGENEQRPALRGPFRYGDRVQLTGPKGRMNTITLVPGQVFHSHRGMLRHDDLVGVQDGTVVTATSGDEYLALRPLLSDFVMSMPRGAAIVYPKDAAQILSLADIFPGARVVEAGVGSGALSLHLLRAIGESGELFSFERRQEFADVAQANVAAFAGAVPANWRVTVGDLQEELPRVVAPGSVDRVVLDMLAPWECVEQAAECLIPGGVLICYVATVTQLSRTAEAVRQAGCFTHPQSSETMVRGWHVEGLAVRPDHRMVAHTGFLLTARRLAPAVSAPDLRRRASKSDFSAEDMQTWLPDMGDAASADVWTPEAVGEWQKSDKILRKKAREAQRFARERGSELPPSAAA